MAIIPPMLLVLDISALSGGSPREWIEFSRVGTVYIPQAVYEEMRLLYDRSPDRDLEQLSKSFSHFYPSSNWKITDAHAHHTSLKGASGQALTHRSRVALAAARCAYALSLSFPGQLVVLVSSDQAMLQRVYDIPSNNLCAINPTGLLQWSRTGQRPIAVSQKLQQLRLTGDLTNSTISSIRTTTSPSRITSTPTKSTPSSRISRPVSKTNSKVKTRPAVVPTAALSQLISLLLAFGGVAIAAWLLWTLVNNTHLLEPLRKPVAPTQQSG